MRSELKIQRVMLDTNVLLSMLLFPSKQMETLLLKATTQYQLVLSSFIINELLNVIKRKFKGKEEVVIQFIRQLSYEHFKSPEQLEPGLFRIRDEFDYPVLYSAIAADVDIFITGDKDFFDLDFERPKVVTPAAFVENY